MDREAWRATVHGVLKIWNDCSNKLCVPQDPKTPQRLRLNCVWLSPEEIQVSSVLPQVQGLWVQQTWVWHKPSWKRSPLTHHRAARTYTGLGKQTLRGHKQNLVTAGPRREEQWPYKRQTQECLGLSSRGVGQRWPAAGPGALSGAVLAGSFGGRSPLSSSPPP